MRYRFHRSISIPRPLRTWLCGLLVILGSFVSVATAQQTLSPTQQGGPVLRHAPKTTLPDSADQTQPIRLIKGKPIRLRIESEKQTTPSVMLLPRLVFPRSLAIKEPLPSNNSVEVATLPRLPFPFQRTGIQHAINVAPISQPSNRLVLPVQHRNTSNYVGDVNLAGGSNTKSSSGRSTLRHDESMQKRPLGESSSLSVQHSPTEPTIALLPAPVRRLPVRIERHVDEATGGLTISFSDQSSTKRVSTDQASLIRTRTADPNTGSPNAANLNAANLNVENLNAENLNPANPNSVRQVQGVAQPTARTLLASPQQGQTSPQPSRLQTPSFARQDSAFSVQESQPLVPTEINRNAYASGDSIRQEMAAPNQFAADRPEATQDRVVVPVPHTAPAEDITMNRTDGLVTLIATGAELPGVLRLIADHHDLNLVLGPEIAGPVTVSIRGARLEEVLDAILGVAGFSWHQSGNLLYVTGSESASMNPRVQGRIVRVYPLNYVSAQQVEAVATRLLSPVGTAFISESAIDDQRRTAESLIIEDTQDAHNRIAQYITQIDIAPKQVLVEAHVLQVALNDSDRHGINLQSLARLDGTRVTVEGNGFVEDGVGGPSLALRLDGTDMDGLIELIQENTNSRTLASPKLSVVNHQEARIQIGQRLPYSVATTTQTSTIQTVEFLDVGIVLTVLPIITDDGNVLMTVLPKVSGGRITESGFPEEDTTELSTTILMPDGGGIVIGGLIREEDSHIEASVPGLSRVPMVGKLFQRRSNEHRRNELIIALVTHVLPDLYSGRSHEQCELEKILPPYAKRELQHPAMPSSNFHQGHPILHSAKRPSRVNRR